MMNNITFGHGCSKRESSAITLVTVPLKTALQAEREREREREGERYGRDRLLTALLASPERVGLDRTRQCAAVAVLHHNDQCLERFRGALRRWLGMERAEQELK